MATDKHCRLGFLRKLTFFLCCAVGGLILIKCKYHVTAQLYCNNASVAKTLKNELRATSVSEVIRKSYFCNITLLVVVNGAGGPSFFSFLEISIAIQVPVSL